MRVLVHTLLHQIVRCSSDIAIVRRFLYSLLEGVSQEWGLKGEEPPQAIIKKLLEVSNDDLWDALRTVLDCEQSRELSIVVDGLDCVQHQRGEFIRAVRSFVKHLQQRLSKVMVLLTSQKQADVKEAFEGLPCIEYDKERLECLSSLNFDNTRLSKISKEHKGSCDWLWERPEYLDWSTSPRSCLLLIEGKPGSGKSTLTKYFSNNLEKRRPAAESAIVARFFYSYREGELQRSHCSMLRSVLYDVLRRDQTFFYHRFQTEYRAQPRRGLLVEWDYDSLKAILKSLQDQSPAKPLYLIIDAVDESEDRDRRDVLNILFELCSETKCRTMKAFVASRPVGEIELRRSRVQNSIKLQDVTKSAISSFACSFLKDLQFTRLFDQATEYIVENAQGVFLWVDLVGRALLDRAERGSSEDDIFGFLRSLPKDLKDFYRHMFKKMILEMRREEKDIRDGIKMFRFVLYARRSLTVSELLHALGVPDDPNTAFPPLDDSFERFIPSKQRIHFCGGNFLESKPHNRNEIVQVMHQTVREFFLHPDGDVPPSEFGMCEKDSHICISIICIRYLMLCATNTNRLLPDVKSWTSEHFEDYAQSLHQRPLANYALCHLKYHIDG
ncbi:uncharacterized protein BKA55DRAFT_525091, partial [Fusarium redolens]